MDLLQIHIKELKVGNHIVNLGKVLEIEPSVHIPEKVYQHSGMKPYGSSSLLVKVY